MSSISKYLLPIALTGCLAVGIGSECKYPVSSQVQYAYCSPDTVVYPSDGYRLRRRGNFSQVQIADSLLSNIKADSLWGTTSLADTTDSVKVLTARDTIFAPDSLKYIDPFRYKYYVALLDSKEHKFVSDSLLKSYLAMKDSGWVELYQADSLDRYLLDSLYISDSTFRAKAAFEAWYNSLTKEERKKYDKGQAELIKMARLDSLTIEKEKEKQIKDSIVKNTPRVLNTYAVTREMHFKQIIKWTQDKDFGDLQDVSIPDTSCNFHFYDYKFQRQDVNATWLGVAGSPTQSYNYFKRNSETGMEFFDAMDSWTYSPQTMEQFNSKTPHTELAYYGTIFDTREKEYDNIRIFTTQNITPAMNFSILYEKWGGGGMLINQKTKNKTFAAGYNYIGERYVMNSGFISNNIELGENGGVKDLSAIRDTTIEIREVDVNNKNAKSTAKKTTVYLNQQFRIAGDSATFDDPCIFLGHSTEFTKVGRAYTNGGIKDTLGASSFDNRFYVRLQPFSPTSALSKLDLGIGDVLKSYHNVSAQDTSVARENTIYAYAGLQGSVLDKLTWQVRTHLAFAGADAGNSDASFNARMKFYPFRKDKLSPLTVDAKVSTELERPYFYQRHNYSLTNPNLVWDNDLKFTRSVKLEANVDIPYWAFDANVSLANISNKVYYDQNGILGQYENPLTIFSTYLRKDLVLFNFLHLDNRLLLQASSNQEVLPVPLLAANLKYFVQFPVKENVMDMQVGVNAWANTKWYSPGWNPALGVFYNQREEQYNNGPFFDVFINMQWKDLTMFFKWENIGKGWPMDKYDYFSAHRYIYTQNGGIMAFKFGLFWPFHMRVTENKQVHK